MQFKRNLALVIGINQYENGINPLQTAVPDVQKLSSILTEVHDYTLIHPDADTQAAVLNTEATLAQLRTLLSEVLPNRIQPTCHDRLFIYFAGHGITRQIDDQGPQGFLVPQDADINNCDSLLPMSELYDALNQLECRHLFIILDCCFAGMFRWASTRKVVLVPDEIHWEHYHRFIKYPAWQVITSAAHNQEALDYLDNRTSDASAKHSPFAKALFEGLLEQKADLVPDGVITAAELYLYLRDYVEKHSNERQTPGFWPLNKHDRGEYIFQLVSEENLNLKPAPKLEKDNNPYRGLEAFEEKHAHFFFGREEVIKALIDHLLASQQQFTIVDGISGSGKSSLVKAGLLPKLREQQGDRWHIFEPVRPGSEPYLALARTLLPPKTDSSDLRKAGDAIRASADTLPLLMEAWSQRHEGKKLLLVIDQFEELVTLAPTPLTVQGKVTWGRRFVWQPTDAPSEGDFRRWQVFSERLVQAIEACPQMHVLVTLRSDFAPRFQKTALSDRWGAARFFVRPMRSDELREAAIGPANEMALYFEPAKLVDTLIDEVAQTPGALPLLSFTLSELYLKLYAAWNKEGKDDRALCVDSDFYRQGGVAGLLARRANEEYERLPDEAHQKTMRRVMLRMVALEGSEAVKHRVSRRELLYVSEAENQRVETVLNRLDTARLIVGGNEAGIAYVEPAHDFLVHGWDRLQTWIREERETLLLQQLLVPASNNWLKTRRDLWNGNSRLSVLKKIQKSRNNWLNGLEVLFVRCSLNRKRFNWGLRLGLIGFGTAIAGGIWVSSTEALTVLGEKLQQTGEELKATGRRLDDTRRANVLARRENEALTQDIAERKRSLDKVSQQVGEEKERAEFEEQRAAAATRQAAENSIKAQQTEITQLSETARVFLSNRKPMEAMDYAIQAADRSKASGVWGENLPSAIPMTLLTAIEENHELRVLKASDETDEDNAQFSEADSSESGSSESDSNESGLSGSAQEITAIAIAPDGNTIVSGDHKGNLHFFSVDEPSSDALRKLISLGTAIQSLTITAENELLASIGSKESAELRSIKMDALFWEEKSATDSVDETIKLPGEIEDRLVATATASRTIVVADKNSAKIEIRQDAALDSDEASLWKEIPIEGIETITQVAISDDGETIAIRQSSQRRRRTVCHSATALRFRGQDSPSETIRSANGLYDAAHFRRQNACFCRTK